jgi:hypothetical protein
MNNFPLIIVAIKEQELHIIYMLNQAYNFSVNIVCCLGFQCFKEISKRKVYDVDDLNSAELRKNREAGNTSMAQLSGGNAESGELNYVSEHLVCCDCPLDCCCCTDFYHELSINNKNLTKVHKSCCSRCCGFCPEFKVSSHDDAFMGYLVKGYRCGCCCFCPILNVEDNDEKKVAYVIEEDCCQCLCKIFSCCCDVKYTIFDAANEPCGKITKKGCAKCAFNKLSIETIVEHPPKANAKQKTLINSSIHLV